jgi:hypothetical protein
MKRLIRVSRKLCSWLLVDFMTCFSLEVLFNPVILRLRIMIKSELNVGMHIYSIHMYKHKHLRLPLLHEGV